MTDVELLEKHRAGCDQAFADLVRRHLGWVYGVARRRLKDSHLAEDVAQAVFILLHRKAPRFPADGAMVNWLHRTTWYATETAIRNQRRRQKYETEAAMRHPGISQPADEWEELASLLDQLIGQLKTSEREVVLLRYYRDLSFDEVATQIGTTEEAARKRTERAIEKLRLLSGKRGVEISGAALSAGLLTNVRMTPPPGLVASATTAATAPAGSALVSTTTAIVKGTGIMMASTKASLAIGAVSAVLFVGGTIWFTSDSKPAGSAQATSAPAQAPLNAAIPAMPASPDNINVGWAAGNVYPKLSPFSGIEWRDNLPRVKVGETWYEWLGLNDQTMPEIVAFAHKADRKDWQKRIGEDLVEVLARMGHEPSDTVKMQLRTLDTGSVITLSDIPMTQANRQAIWQARNAQ